NLSLVGMDFYSKQAAVFGLKMRTTEFNIFNIYEDNDLLSQNPMISLRLFLTLHKKYQIPEYRMSDVALMLLSSTSKGIMSRKTYCGDPHILFRRFHINISTDA
ncbi:hypothetical protein BY458DRAFT_495092, partial [Sporodiniella umbellata]